MGTEFKFDEELLPQVSVPESSATPNSEFMLPPGMSFPGGLEAMMNYVEQHIGSAEKQLQDIAEKNYSMLDAGCLIATNVRGLAGQPVVYGNTQTGYRADLRHGADVRPVMNCHQCKTNKKRADLVFCGHVSIDAKGYSTTCTKRYCRTCLWNWYMEQAPQNDPNSEPMWNIWRCPSCRKLCCCHRCRTFGKMQRGMDFTDLVEQAGALSPARCLARSLAEAPQHISVKESEISDLHSSGPPFDIPKSRKRGFDGGDESSRKRTRSE